jgi:hypothetical protein
VICVSFFVYAVRLLLLLLLLLFVIAFYRAVTIIYLKETMFLGHLVLQPFCNYISWHMYCYSHFVCFVLYISTFPTVMIIIISGGSSSSSSNSSSSIVCLKFQAIYMLLIPIFVDSESKLSYLMVSQRSCITCCACLSY